MPITVVLELHLRDEVVDDVLAGLERDLPDTRAYDGNVSVDVVRDMAQPGHIVLIERWERREDQERYIAWRQETGSMDNVVAQSTAPPTITYYEELTEV
jgi:quinol monooxygenase YgiN